MQLDITNKDLQTLLALYNEEIDHLKAKLLNGESWEDVKPIRRNITELAIALQKSHGYIVSGRTTSSIPPNSPKLMKSVTNLWNKSVLSFLSYW